MLIVSLIKDRLYLICIADITGKMIDKSVDIFVEDWCSDYKEPNRDNRVPCACFRPNYDNFLGVSEEFKVVHHWH